MKKNKIFKGYKLPEETSDTTQKSKTELYKRLKQLFSNRATRQEEIINKGFRNLDDQEHRQGHLLVLA